VIVQVQGDQEAARRALAGVPGVKGVENGMAGAEPSWHTFILRGEGAVEESVGAALAQAGLRLRELTRQLPTLERVFLEMIESDGAAGLVAGGGP